MAPVIRTTPFDIPAYTIDERGFWSVVLPETTTNLLPNPSFEFSVSPWSFNSDSGGAVTQEVAESFSGTSSARMIKDAGGTFATIFLPAANRIPVTPGLAYTLSGRIKHTQGHARIEPALVTYTSAPLFIATVANGNLPFSYYDWTYFTVTHVAEATAATMSVDFAILSSNNALYYIDALMVEQKPYPTTYVDGDVPGCYWTAGHHNSTSIRPGTVRSGGRVVMLDDLGFTVDNVIGAGAAPYNTIITPFALLGGGYYQRSVSPPRTFSLIGRTRGYTLNDLKRHKQALVEAVSPDLILPQQPARLVYQPERCRQVRSSAENIPGIGPAIVPESYAILIDAVYTSGLEGSESNEFIEAQAMNFTALKSPALGMSEGQKKANLVNFLSGSHDLLRRSRLDGSWISVTGSGSNPVYKAVMRSNGDIYAIRYTHAAAGDRRRVVRWDTATSAWVEVGLVPVGETVLDLAFDTQDNLWIVGTFTSVSGTAADKAAKWNGATWSAVGVTLDGGAQIDCIAIDEFDRVYVGGTFTQIAAGPVSAGRIATYDGATWTQMGDGVNNQVMAILLGRNGQQYPLKPIYIGGSFTATLAPSSISLGRTAQWNLTTFTNWKALGQGVGSPGVTRMAFGLDGKIYAGGQFTTLFDGTACNSIAVFDGSTWTPIGAGLRILSPATSIIVGNLAIDEFGALYLTGSDIESAGNAPYIYRVAKWNGSDWVYPDIDNSDNSLWLGNLSARSIGSVGELYMSADGSVTATRFSSTTTVSNPHAAASPTLIIRTTTFTPPVYLKMIREWRSQAVIYTNIVMAANEEIRIFTGNRVQITSNKRGDLTGYIMAGSNLGFPKINHGDNYFNFLLEGLAGLTTYLVWNEAFDSINID